MLPMTNISPPIAWQNLPVDVQANLVPRYLWTSASIDVYIAGQCVLRTGGVLSPVGSQSATFMHGNTLHTVQLSWGRGVLFSFPYELFIDGIPVSASRVPVSNWVIGLLPITLLTLILLGAAAVIIFLFFRLQT